MNKYLSGIKNFSKIAGVAFFLSMLGKVHSANLDFPSKPISLVVPFAAGGSLDIIARALAEEISRTSKQPMVIVNRPGGGTSLAARYVANAEADGHTLFASSGSAHGYMNLLIPNYKFTINDFTPIAGIAKNPSVLVASTQSGIKTLDEMVKLDRNKPDAIKICSTGANGLNHLQIEIFRETLKKRGGSFSATHIPYNGVAPALAAIQAGDVNVCALPFTSLISQLHGKSLNILAVQTPSRVTSLPTVPTTGESGYPEMDGNEAMINISGPKGISPDIAKYMSEKFKAALKSKSVQERFAVLGVSDAFMGPEDLGRWLANDSQRYSEIIKKQAIN